MNDLGGKKVQGGQLYFCWKKVGYNDNFRKKEKCSFDQK